jgi:hypothetical protein
MNFYIVKIAGNWDFDTSLRVCAKNPSKAKGQYIKRFLSEYVNDAGYTRSSFFKLLRVSKE